MNTTSTTSMDGAGGKGTMWVLKSNWPNLMTEIRQPHLRASNMESLCTFNYLHGKKHLQFELHCSVVKNTSKSISLFALTRAQTPLGPDASAFSRYL